MSEETKEAGLPPEDHDPKLAWPIKWVLTYQSGGDLWDYSRKFETEAEGRTYLRRRGSSASISVTKMTWAQREYMIDYERHRERPIWWEKAWWTDNTAIHAPHFTIVSEDDRELLSYFAEPSKAVRGIRTKIRPGRYLTKFFGGKAGILSEKEIAFMQKWQATGNYPSSYTDEKIYPLLFATTPDEIEEVYVSGPRSCMSHTASRYSSSCHPARVYGAGDLAIAYLNHDKGHHKAGSPCCRALVWPEKKIAGRIYPNVEDWDYDGFESREDANNAYQALFQRLSNLGYMFLNTKTGGFDGAKIVKIIEKSNKAHAVLPYLDGAYKVSDKGDHFIMDSKGAIYGGSQSGIVEVPLPVTCDRCSRTVSSRNNLFTVVTEFHRGSSSHSQRWCSECVETHSYVCCGSGNRVSSRGHEFGLILGSEERISEDWARYNWMKSALSNRWFNGPRRLMADGSYWAKSEFVENGFECEITAVNYPNSERHPEFIEIWRGCSQTDIVAWRKRKYGEVVEAALQVVEEAANTIQAEITETVNELVHGNYDSATDTWTIENPQGDIFTQSLAQAARSFVLATDLGSYYNGGGSPTGRVRE